MKISSYLFLENEATAQLYLTQKYKNLTNPKKWVYQNLYTFTSFIKQGTTLFQTANQSDFWSKPLLLYYGMMSLLKAFALSQDSSYPKDTSILQHGLTSPKRKKAAYRFENDEVRIQKDGFFPYLCQLFQTPVATGERYKVNLLCSFLPDIQTMIEQLYHKSTQSPILIQPSADHRWNLVISNNILDQLCLSAEAFIHRLNNGTKQIHFRLEEQRETFLTLMSNHNPEPHPLIYQQENGDYSLWIGDSHQITLLPEILAQYAPLFSLSMLCRYDPPRWRELNNDTESEQLLIQTILKIVEKKFPRLLLKLLQID